MTQHLSYSDPLVRFILSSGLESCKKDLKTILSHLNLVEIVEIQQWTDYKWYVMVVDTTLQKKYYRTAESPRSIRLTLSFDIKNDRILWNHMEGHCSVRGRRWCRIFASSWIQQTEDNQNINLHGVVRPKHFYVYEGLKNVLETTSC